MTRSLHTGTPAGVGRSGRADVVSGLVVSGAGVLLLVSARTIEDAVRAAPGIGPATLPTALSALLIISGLLLAGIGLRHRPAVTEPEADAVEPLVLPEERPVPWRRLVVVVGLFVGYALVFIPLGYMLATALFLGAMVTVIDRARWKRNVVFAVVFAVVVYHGFTELLGVQLPAGLLG